MQLIRAWSARARLQHSLHWLFFGLACGLGIALVIAVLARIFPILSATAVVGFAVTCALLGALSAFLWPWARAWRRSPASWARQFDQQFKLKERLSTAIELHEGTLDMQNDSLRRQQQADAGQVAEGIDIHKRLPLRLSERYILFTLAIGLALTLAIALPNPQQAVLANRAQLQQVLAEQLRQVEEVKQEVEQSPALDQQQKKQVIQALDEVQQALGDPTTTPEQAMAAINDVQSKLDALRDQEWPDQREDLQRAGQSMAPDEMTNSLANSLENGNFEQAAEDVGNLTQQKGGQPLNDEQRQRIADQIEQMARSVQNTDSATAQQLREAAQKLREGKDAEARELLAKVAEMLKQASQKEATGRQIEQAQIAMEDTRRAVSEASNQSQASTGQQGEGENSQAETSGAQGQNQEGQTGRNTTELGQGNAQLGNRQNGATGSEAAVSGNAQGTPGNGSPNSAHHEDSGSDSSVYAPPPRLADNGEGVGLPDENGKNVPDPNARSNTGASNTASVPYQEVYPNYAKAADEALQNGEVPSGLRDYVRDYFSSLDPRQR
ncbi:MAG: hypothetical protein M1546_07700 [Chloroflexi bacterium]|nr:hypothetical protein [Chloroflexota bacterium]